MVGSTFHRSTYTPLNHLPYLAEYFFGFISLVQLAFRENLMLFYKIRPLTLTVTGVFAFTVLLRQVSSFVYRHAH